MNKKSIFLAIFIFAATQSVILRANFDGLVSKIVNTERASSSSEQEDFRDFEGLFQNFDCAGKLKKAFFCANVPPEILRKAFLFWQEKDRIVSSYEGLRRRAIILIVLSGVIEELSVAQSSDSQPSGIEEDDSFDLSGIRQALGDIPVEAPEQRTPERRPDASKNPDLPKRRGTKSFRRPDLSLPPLSAAAAPAGGVSFEDCQDSIGGSGSDIEPFPEAGPSSVQAVVGGPSSPTESGRRSKQSRTAPLDLQVTAPEGPPAFAPGSQPVTALTLPVRGRARGSSKKKLKF